MKTSRYLILFCITLLAFTNQSFGQKVKGTYAIKNVKTGLLLRIKDANNKDKTPLVAYTPINWKCMTWDFQQVEGATYQLRNLFTNKTFQPASAPNDGVALEQMPLVKNEKNQEWEFIPVSKDIYQIKLKNSNLYLTPSDENGTVNSPIILSEKRDGELQNWMIYLQNPTM